MPIALRPSLSSESLDVMNFLNEVVLRFPDAVSFAPGRPAESLFDVEHSLGQIERYVAREAGSLGQGEAAVLSSLGQYGKTNGLIQQRIAEHLRRDEAIDVPPAAIMVTTGCQEAMLVLMMGLFDPARDVLLVSDPTYIGITGLAQILEVPVVPVASGDDGLEPEAVADAIERVRRSGKRVKAVYDIPDFNNPLGTSMPAAARHLLLEVARRHRILIFEDNPYGMFSYDQDPMPTLKALESRDREAGEDSVVVYLGSFSKTLFPGLRLGYLVADQRCESSGSGESYLAQELSRVKSLTTVNTSPLIQAIAGGILLEREDSLRDLMTAKCRFYKANRDHMLDCLDKYFTRHPALAETVHWNRPGGGFFLTMTLPFAFDDECLRICAGEYGVICCPMSFFSLRAGQEHQIRLSFSYVTPEQIEQGVRRLARFVASRVAPEEETSKVPA